MFLILKKALFYIELKVLLNYLLKYYSLFEATHLERFSLQIYELNICYKVSKNTFLQRLKKNRLVIPLGYGAFYTLK